MNASLPPSRTRSEYSKGTMNRRRFPFWVILAGVAAVAIYLATATGFLKVNTLTLALVFAIGPLAIIGMLSVSDRLSPNRGSLAVRAGLIFLIIAFAFFTMMLAVQQTIFIQFQQFQSDAPNEETVQTLKYVFKGVNLVQLGMDVGFDVFYCFGMILFAAAMIPHPDFGRFLGIFGIISAAGLLILNIAAFPFIPADSGLVDLGPLTGVWWLLVIGQMLRLRRREKKSVATQ